MKESIVNREEVRAAMAQENISLILVQFVDMHGSAKCKMIPVEAFDDALESGAGFAGAAVWGLGQGPHDHDMLARIDLDSYTPIPWKPGVARFASDLFVDEEPHRFCARTNLKRVLGAARERGYVFNVGMEPEHFLVTRDGENDVKVWDPDGVDNLMKPCYDFRSMGPALDYLSEITTALNQLGWGVYQCDHEDANGQFEVNFDYADALTTSDRLIFFKMTTSQVAKKYGAIATHMPKPFSDRTGSGAHLHFHLADAETGINVFLDEDDKRGLGLSEAAYQFIGGVLDHAPALCAVTSPTVNCYKRLQVAEGIFSSMSGYTWTPAFITYGDNNRTQMIRTAGPGHLEDRTVSAACNPYLAAAAYLEAGLDGIERKLDPGDPNLGNMYDLSLSEIREQGVRLLPQSLWEAINNLRTDKVVKSALGAVAEDFVRIKEGEWEEYNTQITRWEVNRYLTMI
jgi:glutamine synthetase